MGTCSETDAAVVDGRRACGRTTMTLERTRDGDWRATRDGVDVVGRGETAAVAAPDYCRSVEGADE